MEERRKGQHRAVHHLAQVYADLLIAINEVEGLNECERRHRALCFLKADADIIRDIVDRDLGPKLITKERS